MPDRCHGARPPCLNDVDARDAASKAACLRWTSQLSTFFDQSGLGIQGNKPAPPFCTVKMCGRYALALRPSDVRRHLEDSSMPSQDSTVPDDDDARQTHNFAPGYYGLVYRAAVPDYGGGDPPQDKHNKSGADEEGNEDEAQTQQSEPIQPEESTQQDKEPSSPPKTEYRLQSMKWGLVPFWTKRNPDYGSMMRTINCRDDSLALSSGMWTTMKMRKRCIVVAQGFYEWLKKPNSKEKIPHYVKRKDGQLMCFAGLWDCVKFEDSENKLYTYTIITTESNKQLGFLHDRMPVILNNGSNNLFKWLEPTRNSWTKELQSLLKPFSGELDCYPVSKEVGKVGNDSPRFVVPLDSSENKQNIANFFGNQQRQAEKEKSNDNKSKENAGEDKNGETNAPLPNAGQKHKIDEEEDEIPSSQQSTASAGAKVQKTSSSSPIKITGAKTNLSSKKNRNAISNLTHRKAKLRNSPSKASDGSKKITSFFNG